MDKVRFGIIGCGVISSFHARAIADIEEAELYGCVDAYAPSAERFAKEHGVKQYASLEEMLSDPAIDAVTICTPSGLHTQQAIAAMRAGKHVVCEKPMSLTLEQADELIRTANETGVKVCIISQFRFTPAVQAVKKAIEAGALGKIVSGSLQMKYFRSDEYYASGAWRGTWAMDGGGCLMNQGIHGVDLLQYLVGPVTRVSAFCKTQTRPIETEDSAAAALEFACGAVGTLEGSTTCFPGYPRRIEICGEKGSVVLEEDEIVRWDLPEERPETQESVSAAASDPSAIRAEGHERQLANMVRAILGEEPLWVDAKEGKKPVEIILSIYRSSETGRPVEIRKGE